MSINFCARLCEKSYEDEVEIPGFKTTFISSGNAQAYVLSSSKLAYVVIRGSDEAEDLLSGMKFWRRYGTHAGALDDYASIALQLAVQYIEDDFENKHITFTGHSLGGAMALIGAQSCPFIDNIASVVTFGALKPGGYSFSKRYEPLKERTINVINGSDFVPRMQILSLLPGEKLLICKNHIKRNASKFYLWKSFLFCRFSTRKIDHRIKNYITNLTRNRGDLK